MKRNTGLKLSVLLFALFMVTLLIYQQVGWAKEKGLTGKIVDVMDEDGEHIEIFIE